MKTLDLKVVNDTGIHARPSCLIVESLEYLHVDIMFQNINNNKCANARSILSLLQLAASKNTPIHIVIQGDPTDEEKAAEILLNLFNSGFEKAYL